MLIGGTDDKSFSAVLCKRLATIRFVMDECFHANGHKRVGVVVMVSVEMCVQGYVRVSVGLM